MIDWGVGGYLLIWKKKVKLFRVSVRFLGDHMLLVCTYRNERPYHSSPVFFLLNFLVLCVTKGGRKR